jgi:hypothetical protein
MRAQPMGGRNGVQSCVIGEFGCRCTQVTDPCKMEAELLGLRIEASKMRENVHMIIQGNRYFFSHPGFFIP